MRQPVVSTDSVAQDQIRAFVERILRMKEEAKAIKDDIREIYAEAKANGFDKTVLGQVVSYVEKRDKDNASLMEREALFELYLAALDGATGTKVARAHRHEEPADTASAVVAAAGGEGSENAPALPASNTITFVPKPFRPYCQRPGDSCAGMGRQHCNACERAHAAGEFVQVPFEGAINQ